MKNIFSFKICAAAFRVKQMIRFYKYCEKLGQNVYIYGKNQVKQIHKLSDWLTFLIDHLSDGEECLVVVEGNRVKQLRKSFALA
ncbi:hypothetical protein [Sporolactobacillus laevolacticus]|jgi:hypothetical protein|uniref:Uncharacterized protein n=1 Tax=Sporolactobacillus laevolacticus DSM 442 TaxID=1395513 RepID=V6IZY8_9BACL|nr:hypothetical protein [Sporolactobacillus laevolacticus]EST12446.1 hypothetical protein P343_07395 [Sporolactobacillus laevolacticus DSM 442]MDF2910548.1 hypothetical protein [Sporolactobacillus laevolacticus]MDN3955214.1 hypothetical protein [Sporolactobacillus laevolacticus]